MLRKNRPAFVIGEEPLGKIRGHDRELYLYVERPYPPMLRRPPYPESLETRKDIEKHINEILDILCGDFRALKNYTKSDRYPIPRIPHALEKLAKAKYITKMDFMKGFKQNEGKPNSMQLLIIIFHMGIYEYTWMPFGIKNAPSYFQRMMDTILQEEILEGWMLCSKDVVFEITKERRDEYERIKHELTNTPVPILPDFELPFKLYIDEACSQGLGEALYQRQIVDGEPREGVICYISRKLKDSEDRYGATQTEFLCLVWALEKLYYYLEGAVFEVYTDLTALKYLLKMKTPNRHMLRWQIAIQNYRGNMTIIYKEGKNHANADGHWIIARATKLMTMK
ncbi:hypothetical protein O181_025010 [Austropuccinia psidii MF-1]|uniref:Reverse transcriptase RNase H-like domain-containing protein n=1 Tax=Austropuccinia psidii MF-1 TaxID=1389203 RepID=A0A9Q3CLV0_9BASI|nr:hypothetical protein [Austropuccinia psidii MF-1]